jgi:hypothetical protein
VVRPEASDRYNGDKWLVAPLRLLCGTSLMCCSGLIVATVIRSLNGAGRLVAVRGSRQMLERWRSSGLDIVGRPSGPETAVRLSNQHCLLSAMFTKPWWAMP